MPVPLVVTRVNKRFGNKIMRNLVGMPPFVELEHVGRKSGNVRRTPLCGFVSPDGSTVTIGLTYGPKVDWYRNVKAAGHCRMRVRDDILTLGAPRTLDPDKGMARLPAAARPILRLVNVTDFIELPVLGRD